MADIEGRTVDGDRKIVRIDDEGRLIVVGSGGGSPTDPTFVEVVTPEGGLPTQGGTADGEPATDDPILTAGVYNATPPTYDDGDVATQQMDVNGNEKVREQYAPRYEDNTANRALVEQRNTYQKVTADTQIADGSGFLHTLTFSCDDAAPTAGTVTIYDNNAESGTEIYSETFTTDPFRGYSVTIDASFAIGLYAGFATTADVNVTLSYRAD